MCDYSLAAYNSRLANVGEILVATRFPSGSMGFAAPPLPNPVIAQLASSAFPELWRLHEFK